MPIANDIAIILLAIGILLLLPIVVGSTVVFEIIGPVLTRLALIKTGEAR